MPDGVDYSSARPSHATLRAAGVRFVCRYIGSSNRTTSRHPKFLTPAEARSLHEDGFDLVVVFETTAGRADGGRMAGLVDAKTAVAELAYCGLPPDMPVYFAVDYDAVVGPQIRAYFAAVAEVLGLERVGAYGGYHVIRALFDAGLITYGWQTYAWSGGRWDPRAHIQQYSNGERLGGADVDFDRATRDDIGQWRAAATPSEEDDMANVVSVGATQEAAAPGQEIPANSEAAIRWNKSFSDKHNLFQEDKDGGAYSVVILPGDAGKLWAIADAIVHLEGLRPNDKLEISWDRMSPPAKDGDPWQVRDSAWRLPYVADAEGVISAEIGGQFGLDSSVRLRLRVYNPNPYPVIVASAMAKVSLLKY